MSPSSSGTATAIRNGVSIILNKGDNVEKGDVVQSGSDSTLGITFIDGTVFGLSSNARMVLNEMVYDPNGSNNSSLISLVAGTISFVAGETAKHGDMKVDTPVATMGIRGTAVLVEIDFNVPGQGGAPDAKFQVLVEPDGTTGSYILFDKTHADADRDGQSGRAADQHQPGPGQHHQRPAAARYAKADHRRVLAEVHGRQPQDASIISPISIIPQSLQPIQLANGTSATPIVINVNTPTMRPPQSSSRAGRPPVSTFPGRRPPSSSMLPVIPPPACPYRTRRQDRRFADLDGVVRQGQLGRHQRRRYADGSAKFTSFTYQNAAHRDVTATLNAQQLADIAAVEAKLVPVPDPGNNNNGSATWSPTACRTALSTSSPPARR